MKNRAAQASIEDLKSRKPKRDQVQTEKAFYFPWRGTVSLKQV